MFNVYFKCNRIFSLFSCVMIQNGSFSCDEYAFTSRKKTSFFYKVKMHIPIDRYSYIFNISFNEKNVTYLHSFSLKLKKDKGKKKICKRWIR